MYSQAPVLARALETNPDAICHTNPLRVKSSTLKTQLKKKTTKKKTDEYKQVKKQQQQHTSYSMIYPGVLHLIFSSKKPTNVLTNKLYDTVFPNVWSEY